MTRPPRDQLRQAIDARRKELKLTCLDLDSDAGLASGYFSKYLCGSRNLGPEALEKVIAVLGVEIVLVPKGMLAFGKHVSLERNHDLSTSKMRKIAALGGKARWANVPPEDRTAHAQLIAEVRWNKKRRSAAMRGAATRRRNQAAWVIWQRLIAVGAIESPVTHGFFTGPGMAGLTGSMFKRKGRKRAVTPVLPLRFQNPLSILE
jgi:transcriptional regulator with XRE-family HTH domain